MEKFNKVLLVDDDEVTNFYNEKIIRMSGLCDDIDVVNNGEEALEYLKSKNGEHKIGLILLDINMPVMNGFEFLEEYEKLPESFRAGHLILMLTTSLHSRDLESAKKFHTLSGYLNKPLKGDALVDALKHIKDS